jgi:ABC-type polysaccharide/polyol phosphate transport system ATPase subunit
MGEEVAISLNNVSKCFKRYARPVDRLKEILIMKGETMGIIGRNGAGKSTLLQLICGTLTPTSGEVQVHGRVAALLELGAGFNPEFTGRDNVYMNGAIMGLSKMEVDERFDNIAAFADIKDFIDQPVKTYSSGMYVRLAFASAIHVNPDILIIDEALAVGDMFFQAKCMARMRRMMESGVTVLFVSHDTASVKSLCQRGVFLEDGELKKIGKASEVVATYISLVHGDMNQELKLQVEIDKKKTDENKNDFNIETVNKVFNTSIMSDLHVCIDRQVDMAEGCHRYGDGGVKILDIKLLNSQRILASSLDFKENFTIQVSMRFEKDFPSFCLGYSLRDLKGQMLIGSLSSSERIDVSAVKNQDIYIAEIESQNILNSGIYTISVGVEQPVLINQQHIFLDILEDAVVFQSNTPTDTLDYMPFMIYAPGKMKLLKLSSSDV